MGKKQGVATTLNYRGPQKQKSATFGRGAAIAGGVLLWLALVFAYAGPMAASAAYCLIVDGGVVLLWLAAAIGFGSWLLPLFFGSDRQSCHLLFRVVTAAALGLGAISLIVLGLGLLGWLNQITAIVLVALAVIAAAVRFLRIIRIGSLRPMVV